IDSARATLGTVNAAAGDVRTAIDHANGALDAAHALINKAQTGPGIIATLLNDRQISNNLRALVANLREHGILFYKNKPASSPAPAPDGRLQRQF
ncbi:MAG TPA: hypothetical protein VHY22_07625, partial [Chthoniobacteraceae bacterium]|nr:hypothetical protein [Chthoniobacteraceae bacterium]